eukprot:TRINITY_DN71851_c0_g1_i1.p1 TRINITY_DN71851_c0_g1~~TRINITY_DN71851_c0_g1_i1.p1  ORF type:complete len:880 (+),score=173.86 TRINITY_DN71851_c0_g1_i1:47-2641(+)
MAPPVFQSLKTEGGLGELDAHLETRSYIAGGHQATQDDLNVLGQISQPIDGEKFPHARRWYNHVRALKVTNPHKKWEGQGRGGGGAAAGEGAKGKDQAKLEGLLPGAVMGKVCTRFPPEPSGYLHIGHAKAAMLNNHYARAYNGKLILRFDDTNPSKEKQEFQDAIVSDLLTLGIKPDKVSHTSDHFEHLQKTMEQMIKNGVAYVDDTDVDTMRQERDTGKESARRKQPVKENLRMWEEMLKGSPEGLKCCVRGKLDMQNKNKCLRDPVFYRCKVDTPHHRTGTKYKAYPTYDLACPVVDSLEGVTHALRTIEYKDRDAMYKWVLDNAPGCKPVELVEFSKTQFSHTILSKRKLTLFVEKGIVEGWDDPRFPTVRGIMRRGMTIEGLADFVMTQGMSKATNLMEWDKIWAINKQKIDPIVPRYAAVGASDAVLLKLDGPKEPKGKMEKKHPKNDELGDKLLIMNHEVRLDQEDAQAIEEGEQVTLLHWGNVYIDKIVKDKKSGEVKEMTGRLNLEGNVKDTKKKVHWVPNLPKQLTPVVLREFDHLVTKAKIEDEDVLDNIINPCSVVETEAIGDPLLKTLAKGEKIQLERRGYFIVDKPSFPPGQPVVLIKIPDGKSKDMGMTSKVDPTKLQGGSASKAKDDAANGAGKDAKGTAKDSKAAAKDAKSADGGKKNDGDGGKAKGKAKAAPAKPAERPINDISRLDIRVGRITKVWPHPEAEKLYCEEIDLGEGAPRTIASGLRKHLKEEEMKDQLVCVLANLKPRKMQGFESQGMVLCATGSDGRVELLQVPAGTKVGERVMIDGVDMQEADAKLNEKTGKAPLEAVRDGMRTTKGKEAAYNGAVWKTSAGTVTSKTVAEGTIS